jgi:hypothetical protein
MKLVVPHTGVLHAADVRLIRLAEFLGASCEPLCLTKEGPRHPECLERAIPDQNSCLVINPQVIQEWAGGDAIRKELVTSLTPGFRHVLVHALTLDPFVGDIVAAASGGKFRSVLPIADEQQTYDVSSNSEDICGPFSGLSFGPVNATNDRVLAIGTDDSAVRKLICIGGQPNMAVVKRGNTEILLLASDDIVDVNAEIGHEPICNYFSRFMPHAMALRYVFGEECWRSRKSHASIIIDDPLLRPDYGYLNFDSLLRLEKEHNFHTVISFIPHNYRRNSARIVQMFRENPHRLSICFHGNDHTEAEFASTDRPLLNGMLAIGEERMKAHARATGLQCDRVMVFPQDSYSMEALEVLKSRNFHAAVSSPNSLGKTLPLRITDLAQPGVLRHGGVPLFTRSFIRDTRGQDIAFDLFFGRPILIGEHHDTFKHPGSLLELVQKINLIAPGISWSNLESVVDNSALQRRRPDGVMQIKPYSSSVLIVNDSASVQLYSIEWDHSGQRFPIEEVLRDGVPLPVAQINDTQVRVLVELPPDASQMFSVVYLNDHAAVGKPGFVWDARAFLRRRLSEARDNYFSKNQLVLTAAKSLQRRLLK